MITGWPPGMLQDDCRELSRWLANRIDAKMHADDAVNLILNSKCHVSAPNTKLQHH